MATEEFVNNVERCFESKDQNEVITGNVVLLDFTLFPVKPTRKSIIDLGGRLSTALISELSSAKFWS